MNIEKHLREAVEYARLSRRPKTKAQRLELFVRDLAVRLENDAPGLSDKVHELCDDHKRA